MKGYNLKGTGKEYATKIAITAKDTGLTESQVIDWVKRKQKVAKRDREREVDKKENKALAPLLPPLNCWWSLG